MHHAITVSKASGKIISDVVCDSFIEAQHNAIEDALSLGYTYVDFYTHIEVVPERGVIFTRKGEYFVPKPFGSFKSIKDW